MDNNRTKIVVVLDTSGSMWKCKEQTQKGVNNYIQEQKNVPGRCDFTLIEFSNGTNLVYDNVPIADVSTEYVLTPHGGTAMLDAIGYGINRAGKELSDLQEQDRPATVLFVILTDGEENSSKEFTYEQVKNMIETQKNVYNWQFTFLGANQDAILAGSRLGVGLEQSADYSQGNEVRAFQAVSRGTSRVRGASAQGVSLQYGYSEDDRKQMR
jgi:uncharacterized protein YegL